MFKWFGACHYSSADYNEVNIMFEFILWTLLGLSIITASIIFWDVYEYIKRMIIKWKGGAK